MCMVIFKFPHHTFVYWTKKTAFSQFQTVQKNALISHTCWNLVLMSCNPGSNDITKYYIAHWKWRLTSIFISVKWSEVPQQASRSLLPGVGWWCVNAVWGGWKNMPKNHLSLLLKTTFISRVKVQKYLLLARHYSPSKRHVSLFTYSHQRPQKWLFISTSLCFQMGMQSRAIATNILINDAN